MAKGANYVLDKGYLQDGSSAFVAYTAVKAGSDDNHVALGEAAGALGVIQESVDADRVGKYVAAVRLLGITKMVASTAIDAGASVVATTGGKAVTATTGAGLGIALSSAAAANDLIDVLLTPGGVAHT